MSGALAITLAAVLLAGGRADEVRDEQARVHAQRLAQETLLDLLRSQKLGVGQVMQLYGGLAQASRVRGQRLDAELSVLRKRLEVAEAEQTLAAGAEEETLASLGPRLIGLYRLTRQNPLEVLLSAEDFAAIRGRTRAYRSVMAADLRLLGQARAVAQFQEHSLARLDALKASLAERLDEAHAEQEAAARERTELTEALTLVEAEASQSDRVLRDLRSNEAQLGRALEQLSVRNDSSGFGALRGKLPYPTRGILERGFGNVVNPRFNTVTLHKGLDLRAPPGQPVHAVAAGKVVYAGWLKGYGNTLIVEHADGYHTVLAHLQELVHRAGDVVEAGGLLGGVGDSGSDKGSYLYFELRQRGVAIDPAVWLRAED